MQTREYSLMPSIFNPYSCKTILMHTQCILMDMYANAYSWNLFAYSYYCQCILMNIQYILMNIQCTFNAYSWILTPKHDVFVCDRQFNESTSDLDLIWDSGDTIASAVSEFYPKVFNTRTKTADSQSHGQASNMDMASAWRVSISFPTHYSLGNFVSFLSMILGLCVLLAIVYPMEKET